MNAVKRSLAGLVRLLSFFWLTLFMALFRMFFRPKPKRPGSETDQKRAPYPCVPINRPEFRRPDPLLYSQYFLMKQGLAVTWNNPDIILRKDKKVVDSSSLEPGKTYEVIARIWNASADCPVVSMPVYFSFLSFGVGTTSTPIGKTHVDLGVKGGPGCPAYASVEWTTPTTDGHYCIQVLLAPADDLNFENNLGQENTNVVTAHSPAAFTMQLRNATEVDQQYTFEADAYQLLDPAACGPPPARGRSFNASTRLDYPQEGFTPRPAVDRERVRRHAYGAHPLPAGWSVAFTPAAPVLRPGEEITVQVVVNTPDAFKGTQPVNVHAFIGRQLAGGVTVSVVRS